MPRSRAVLLVVTLLLAGGCGGAGGATDGDGAATDVPPLMLGGIPDQDVALLEERFDGVAEHLSDELGIPVRYQPATDYAAVVTAFANGDVQLGWFGGLTGVQARLETPGAHAVLQRPIDAAFRSVFVARPEIGARTVADLAGHSFTFGSESSTSGHLMPRHFLTGDGVDPEADFDGPPGYSGSHDRTWKLVEAGSFDAGVLNEAVWDTAVEAGEVDGSRIVEVARTPKYADYHWVVHPDIDATYGDGTTDRIVDALSSMDGAGEDARRTLALFDDDDFVPTDDAAYAEIERVARSLGLID